MRKVEKDMAMIEGVLWYARRGFYGRVIAERLGITLAQVYGACSLGKVSLKSYRAGENAEAKQVMRMNPFVKMFRIRKAA